jgi:NAD(P)H-dependent flavin oxidoreductase YrpB (nitropropane dioxygenase family)
MMVKRATGRIDGFIVESHTAGGHNAPPRKTGKSQKQSPLHFSEKDIPKIEKIRDLGKPFWLAGGYASPRGLSAALTLGGKGIQVGTVFAYCRESAVMPEIKQAVLRRHLKGKLEVITDFQASPTGYPFKLIHLDDSPPERDGSAERRRVCDVGYLRHLYAKCESEIGYRCPAEPVDSYLRKGGCIDLTIGKQCLCNGLLATIGLGQIRNGVLESPMITAGEDFSFVTHVIDPSTRLADMSTLDYSAKEVIDYLEG